MKLKRMSNQHYCRLAGDHLKEDDATMIATAGEMYPVASIHRKRVISSSPFSSSSSSSSSVIRTREEGPRPFRSCKRSSSGRTLAPTINSNTNFLSTASRQDQFCSRSSPSNKRRSAIAITTTVLLIIATTSVQSVHSYMCQHHQAILEQQSSNKLSVPSLNIQNTMNQQQHPAVPNSQSLLVCPKSSQHNNLPQFPPRFLNPNVERQQREILKHLNESFTNYLNLNGPPAPAPLPLPGSPAILSPEKSSSFEHQTGPAQPEATSSFANELIDDELLNEIISPLVVDAAYLRAKELIVKRRKFENELVKHGKWLPKTERFRRDSTLLFSATNCELSQNRIRDGHEQANCGCKTPACYNNHDPR